MITLHDSFQLLKLYAPTLFECANRSRSDSEVIRKKYESRWRGMAESLKSRGVFQAMTCIFDLLWDASENNKDSCVEYLSFIDDTVRRALDATERPTRKQLEKLAITMIKSFGEERSEYKNHFAEIAVIEKLMTQGGFRLECVEKQLPNGNSTDFEISKGGTRKLIEVYNIDFDTQRLHTSDDLKQFLETRLLNKLKAKLKGIDHLDEAWQVIPVLWGDIMSLVKYIDAFEYFRHISVVAPFMMVARYTHQITGQVVYDFGSVENFLLRAKKREEGKL